MNKLISKLSDICHGLKHKNHNQSELVTLYTAPLVPRSAA